MIKYGPYPLLRNPQPKDCIVQMHGGSRAKISGHRSIQLCTHVQGTSLMHGTRHLSTLLSFKIVQQAMMSLLIICFGCTTVKFAAFF